MGDLTPEQRERLAEAIHLPVYNPIHEGILAVVAELLAEQREGIAAAILTSAEGLSEEAYGSQWITVDDAARIAETYGGAS